MLIDTDSLVAWDSTVQMGLQPAGGCLGCMFGGEGCYNTMTGPGPINYPIYEFPKICERPSATWK